MLAQDKWHLRTEKGHLINNWHGDWDHEEKREGPQQKRGCSFLRNVADVKFVFGRIQKNCSFPGKSWRVSDDLFSSLVPLQMLTRRPVWLCPYMWSFPVEEYSRFHESIRNLFSYRIEVEDFGLGAHPSLDLHFAISWMRRCSKPWTA